MWGLERSNPKKYYLKHLLKVCGLSQTRNSSENDKFDFIQNHQLKVDILRTESWSDTPDDTVTSPRHHLKKIDGTTFVVPPPLPP